MFWCVVSLSILRVTQVAKRKSQSPTIDQTQVLRISRGIESPSLGFHEESKPRSSNFTRNRIPDLQISRGTEFQIFGFHGKTNTRSSDGRARMVNSIGVRNRKV